MFSKRNLIIVLVLILLATVGYLSGIHIFGGGSADRNVEVKKTSGKAPEPIEMNQKVTASSLLRVLPEDEEYYIYAAKQIDAVLNEIIYPLSWYPEDKDMLKSFSEDCLSGLREIEKGIREKGKKGSGKKTKKIITELIRICESTIAGIEKKSDAIIDRESAAIAKKREVMDKALLRSIDKYSEKIEYEAVVSSAEAECFTDSGDRRDYLKSLGYIDEYDFAAAYKTLKELDKRMLSDQARAIVTVRTADCIYNDFAPDNEDNKKLKEDNIKVLERVATGDTYFPGISTAYFKWRTVFQQELNGPSNHTDIPNYYFNKERLKTIKTVRDHIEKNPDDKFARYEYKMLLLAANFKRGQMGNDSTHYFFEYYRRDLREQVGL